MLDPALLCPFHILHDPLRRLPAGLQISLALKILAQIGHGKIRRHGIHIPLREPNGKLIVIESRQHIQVFLFPSGIKELPQAVQSHALSPLPVGVLPKLLFGNMLLFPHVPQKGLVILVQDRQKSFQQLSQLLIRPLPQKRLVFFHVVSSLLRTVPFLFPQCAILPKLFLQLLKQPGQLRGMLYGIVRYPVLLLKGMKIPGRPVQPDTDDPEPVGSRHILFQIITDHDNASLILPGQPQGVHGCLEHSVLRLLHSNRLGNHPSVKAAAQPVFPVHVPEGFLHPVRYQHNGIAV